MSVRYEGADARYAAVYIEPAGTEIGEDVVREGNVALVIEYDEVFYVEGHPNIVRRLLNQALGELNKIAPIVAGEESA